MPKFRLTLICSGLDAEDLDQLELVADVAPDAYITCIDSTIRLHALLEAASVTKATLQLVTQLKEAISGFAALKAELQCVNVNDVAEAVNMNRESVRLWTTGQRGPGDFPRPLSTVGGGRMRVWAQSSVETWLRRNGLPADDARQLSVEEIVDINRALECLEVLENDDAVVVDMSSWHEARRSKVSLSLPVGSERSSAQHLLAR